ncbi:MAG TPA: DNA repair protein RecN [Solibacterales bacterium]|nr:DNA repair protein RecN [Bryobacterales bacterium]
MLLELLVENFAVVERIRVRFHAGFNLLTGETGSGKSIVVDALGLLFGARASAETVRSGAGRARIAGIFDSPPEARALLAEAGVDEEEGELIVEREIHENGKSRAFVNSRPAAVALLKDLAPLLGDIHGQHDQQRLFSAPRQRAMLDDFAGAGDLVSRTADLYRRWRETSNELAELDRREQDQLRLADLWSFQCREIEAAALTPGEDAALELERRVQQNVAKLSELAAAAYEAVYDAEASAAAQLRIAIRRLEELGRIDASLDETLAALKPSQAAVEDAAHAVRSYLGRLESDPARLEEVESRLAAIDKLKRKYGASVEEILSFAAEARSRLDPLAGSGERRAALLREQIRLRGEYEEAAAVLTARRTAAARELEKKVEAELAGLGMERTVFRVAVEPCEPGERGADAIGFLISANSGEEPRPLDKIASGGELSRVALALKTCVTEPGRATTLVFDEVDAGIGGAAAERVGRRLKDLAASQQVLCVTHLAQIAGFGDHHYNVSKREVKGRTVAEIEELTGEARIREIGRMLSGEHLTPEALRHAEQLIRK